MNARKNGGAHATEAKEPRTIDRAVDTLSKKREDKEAAYDQGELRGQKVRSATERLVTRTTSGILYVLVVLACLFAGSWPTAILMSAMSWLACSEFYRISRMLGRFPAEVVGLAAAAAFPVAAMFNPLVNDAVMLLLIIATGVWYVFNARASIADVAISVFAPVYTGFMLASVVSIRLYEPGVHGALLTLGVMGSIWANDALAYLVGSQIGRHKMAPKISPNKSWEGFWGGLVGSIGVWIIVALVGYEGLTIPMAICFGVVTGIAGVVGDLMESRIKRAAGVKDSGHFLPGHGGLLDRTDSLLLGCATAYFLLRLGGVI
jgi:phosphatidate cytidylyltransferase